MNKKKIESDIAAMNRLIANPSIPQEVKDDAQKTLDELTDKLAEADKPSAKEDDGEDAPAAAPKKRKTRSDKGAGKKKPAAKPAKPAKKKKDSKAEERIIVKTDDGDRDIKEISAEDCLKAYYKRREAAKKSAKKRKSKSLFTRLSETLSHAAETAIKSIPKEDVKENPEKAFKAFEKVADIFEIALKQIKEALKPIVDSKDLQESASAKKDMEDLEKLIDGMRKKYGKEKKEQGGAVTGTSHRAEAA